MNVKFIIGVNKYACENIKELEANISIFGINNEKDKANFGNLCVALRGFRMVADATEAILANDDCLKGEDGEFYKKVEDTTEPKNEEAVSDFNTGKANKQHHE